MLKTFLIGIWLIIYHVMCSDKEWNGYPVYSYNSSMPLVHWIADYGCVNIAVAHCYGT